MDSKNFAVRKDKKRGIKNVGQVHNKSVFIFDSCSNDIDSLVIKNSDDVGKYFVLLFINYIYFDRCFELWPCIGICKRMWLNDNNWDGIWCNARLYPIFGKKFRNIG